MKLVTIMMVIASACCTVTTQMLLKAVGPNVLRVIPDFSFPAIVRFLTFAVVQPYIVLAIIIQGAGFALWIIIISRESASVALGLGGASVYLLTAAAEWIIYGNKTPPMQALALGVITIGAVLLGLSAK